MFSVILANVYWSTPVPVPVPVPVPETEAEMETEAKIDRRKGNIYLFVLLRTIRSAEARELSGTERNLTSAMLL